MKLSGEWLSRWSAAEMTMVPLFIVPCGRGRMNKKGRTAHSTRQSVHEAVSLALGLRPARSDAGAPSGGQSPGLSEKGRDGRAVVGHWVREYSRRSSSSPADICPAAARGGPPAVLPPFRAPASESRSAVGRPRQTERSALETGPAAPQRTASRLRRVRR